MGDGLAIMTAANPATGGGSGTVTSVSVASANGFSGSVANGTTTPEITLLLTDAELAAIAGLTSAADKVPYFTGSGTAALAAFTAAGRALVAGADALAQLASLGIQTCYLSADVDNSSAGPGYIDVSGMGFTIVSGGVYVFWYELSTSTAITTTRPIIAVNGPSSPTRLMVNTWQVNQNGGTGMQQTSSTTYDSGVATTSSSGTTRLGCSLRGLIQPSADGTLIPRLKNSVSSSRATVEDGSFGICIKIA